jgi:pyrophosphatase PpaX
VTSLQAILFDLDGTLIDSTELILSSFRHTMRRHLGRQLPDADWLHSMGRPLRVQLREFARDELELNAMLATYSAHNDEHHDAAVALFPGIREMVDELRMRGHTLGIVTSKRRAFALRGLRVSGLPIEWFGAIVTADDVERHKPDPEPLRAALRELGDARPGASAYVGDSPYDMVAARAAGMAAVAVRWGPHDLESLERESPDHCLSEPADLLDIVDGAGNRDA